MLEFSSDKLELLRKKDAYPYEWVDSYIKIIYSRLPLKEAFYSSIDDGKRGKGDGHISNDKYLHLKNVWREFGFRTFKGFHNHYLKKDVLLLADVFEKFISTCLKYYNLDPCHYFSSQKGIVKKDIVKQIMNFVQIMMKLNQKFINILI